MKLLALKIWMILNLIGFILLLFRKDKNQIISDIELMLFKNFPAWIISLLLILLFLPLTIPYSILNIMNGDDSEQNNK